MPKSSYPPPLIVRGQTEATTASPNLVRAITLDPAYEMKTAQVVLTRHQGTLNMSVYRASTSPDAPGMFSREDFERTSSGLKFVGKADMKFLRPEIPPGAKGKVIDKIEVFTMAEMSEEEERRRCAELGEMLRGANGR
jgi:hypothetical protein